MTTALVLLGVALVLFFVVPLALFLLVGERGWLKPSTVRGASVRHPLYALHLYVYGRWTPQYIAWLRKHLRRSGEATRRWWRDRYHGKVLTLEHAVEIVRLEHRIDRRELEQIIPYPMARDLVLDGPPDVAAYECGCRLSRDKHCEPTRVCMIIGQPSVDFILEHHPDRSQRLNQAEAVALLEAEHKRGHLHSAWFKDAAQGRMYAICNCCKCCCAGLEQMVELGSPVIASSGFVAKIDRDLCTDCGVCERTCPFNAIHLEGTTEVTWEKCMGCGVCESQCRFDAVHLQRDARKGEPLDVRALA